LRNIDLALWDTNSKRATALKDRLDMFAGDKETALLPKSLKLPLQAFDAVFISFDDSGEPVLHAARTVRQSGEMTFILLISDRSVDLSPFFRPKIRPSGVLFHPVQNTHIRDLLEEITAELERLLGNETEDSFVFKAEGVTRRLPYRDILFFEASVKKVILHTAGQQISYYDSVEKLAKSLPPNFVRCHRSFIVNSQKIKELYGNEMELMLIGGERVPFSRSYKEVVKKAVSGQSQADTAVE